MSTEPIGPVLVVAAHADDEALGCGGTIARLAGSGREVHVAFLADGVSARREDESSQKKNLVARQEAARQAGKSLGVSSISFSDLPDNRLDNMALLDIIGPLEQRISEVSPHLVITHHAGDLNVDHRRAHQAVVTACRPQQGQPVRELWFFEVPSSTEWQTPGSATAFMPNLFMDIGRTLECKMQALQAYSAEMRPWPHPRSPEAIEHLARWRGASVGMAAAEAFVIGRVLK